MGNRDSFHHGNLRQALMDAAHQTLNRKGADGLSLRQLAADTEVSPSAPYRHFKNKEALLRALIDDASKDLLTAYQQAVAGNTDPEEQLRAACNAYLDFAIARQGLYCLLLEGDGASIPSNIAASEHDPSFQMFTAMVSAMAPGLTPEKALQAAVACWSLLHGFASLNIHGALPDTAAQATLRSTVVDAAIAVPPILAS